MARIEHGVFVDVAARLFAARGYTAVSIADILDEVGCTPPTLYRRFPSKLALLHAVIDSALEEQELAGGDLAALIDRALAAAAAAPDLIVSYFAGRRWLEPNEFLETAARDAQYANSWRAAIETAAPTLAAPAVAVRQQAIAAIVAASTNISRVAGGSRLRDAFAKGLHDLATTPYVEADREARPPGWQVPPTRRQEILDAAIALMGERGYAEVRVEDVGRAVGISGPSVLQHFATKQQLLVEAFERGVTEMMVSARHAAAGASSAEQALHRLVLGLSETAAEHRDLFATLIRESGGLDEPNRDRVGRLRRDYDDVWAAVIRQVWNDINGEAARMIARAGTDAVMSGPGRSDGLSPATDTAACVLAFIYGVSRTFCES